MLDATTIFYLEVSDINKFFDIFLIMETLMH